MPKANRGGRRGTPEKDSQKLVDWLKDEGSRGGRPRPLDIQQFQGYNLERAEQRIRNLDHEEMFVFDKNGNLLYAYKGGKDSVAFPASMLRENNLIVTHGHPKGVSGFGGTFSFADVKNMIVSNWAEHRATASGQGELNYIMRRTAKSDGNGLYNQINKDYVKLKADIQSTYNYAYDKSIANGDNVKHAKHVARQTAVGILNAYYKKVMPQFGFEYITRKKNYSYNGR